MKCHLKIHSAQAMLKNIKESTIYSAFSVGSRASKFGTDAEYLENFVTKINSLKNKPKNAFLFIAWELQRFNFDQFIVSLNTPQNGHVNKSSVLTDEELFNVFKALESDPILQKISDEKDIDTDLAAELFAKMFEPAARKEGALLTNSLIPIWDKLEAKTTQDGTMQRGVLSLGDVIRKYDMEEDWDDNGKKYNKFRQNFETIEKEYADNVLEKQEFDTTIQDVFTKRKFIEAGERLKIILSNAAYSRKFENQALIKFINAILNYLDFEKIGKKEIRMYLFTELAQMRSEPSTTFILYPHKPHKNLQKYYDRHKIPLVLTNMYPIRPEENQKQQSQKQEKISINEQKKSFDKKSSEPRPKKLSELPSVLFPNKNKKPPSTEEKYSFIDNGDKKNSSLEKKHYEDFKLEPLENKYQEPIIFPASPLKQSHHTLSSPPFRTHHDLPSLNIPSTFYSPPPPLTPATALKVGTVRMDLLTVVMMLEKTPYEGAPSLIFAEDKLESILMQVKLLNSNMSHSLQQNNVIYSPKRTLVT